MSKRVVEVFHCSKIRIRTQVKRFLKSGLITVKTRIDRDVIGFVENINSRSVLGSRVANDLVRVSVPKFLSYARRCVAMRCEDERYDASEVGRNERDISVVLHVVCNILKTKIHCSEMSLDLTDTWRFVVLPIQILSLLVIVDRIINQKHHVMKMLMRSCISVRSWNVFLKIVAPLQEVNILLLGNL